MMVQFIFPQPLPAWMFRVQQIKLNSSRKIFIAAPRKFELFLTKLIELIQRSCQATEHANCSIVHSWENCTVHSAVLLTVACTYEAHGMKSTTCSTNHGIFNLWNIAHAVHIKLLIFAKRISGYQESLQNVGTIDFGIPRDTAKSRDNSVKFGVLGWYECTWRES